MAIGGAADASEGRRVETRKEEEDAIADLREMFKPKADVFLKITTSTKKSCIYCWTTVRPLHEKFIIVAINLEKK